MIKFMIYFVKIIIAVIFTLIFNSCKNEITSIGNTFKGNGNVITKERNVANFTKIEVSRALDCEVFQSDKFKVEIIADENLHEHINTDVANGKLEISSEYGNYINVTSKLVRVYLPVVDALEATSASKINTNGTIKSNNILVKSSSAATINASIESENIALESSSGSTLNTKGKAIKLTAHSSSGSSIKANELLANEVYAESTSGSTINVNPIVKLNAKASSGSNIEYYNHPKEVKRKTSSGGSISEN